MSLEAPNDALSCGYGGDGRSRVARPPMRVTWVSSQAVCAGDTVVARYVAARLHIVDKLSSLDARRRTGRFSQFARSVAPLRDTVGRPCMYPMMHFGKRQVNGNAHHFIKDIKTHRRTKCSLLKLNNELYLCAHSYRSSLSVSAKKWGVIGQIAAADKQRDDAVRPIYAEA